MAPTIGRRLRFLLWPPPEPELADAGRAGELVIAKARLVLLALLTLPALLTLARDPEALSGRLGLPMSLVLVAVSAVVLRRARAGGHSRRLATVATLFDVSVLSAYHLLLFIGGDVETALHSRVTFALYILAIAATALRYDGGLVRLAGGAAIVEYLAVVAWADATGRAGGAGRLFYGETALSGQLEEVVVLLVATVLGSLLVERARELRLSGIRDPLTRLANRSHFEDRFEQEIERARRSGQPLSVAMIDIDHFKRVNDEHGHAAGDLVLRSVATLMRRSFRRGDVIARFGGEEFAAVLPGTGLVAAYRRIEALRDAMSAGRHRLSEFRSLRVTISAGLACWPEDGADGPRLLETADARLLTAKRAGRDRVVAADEAPGKDA